MGRSVFIVAVGRQASSTQGKDLREVDGTRNKIKSEAQPILGDDAAAAASD